ncbi:MAG: hypothetical protein PUK77_06075 [bacterium]|nr:hypothetical protein [bacterium]
MKKFLSPVWIGAKHTSGKEKVKEVFYFRRALNRSAARKIFLRKFFRGAFYSVFLLYISPEHRRVYDV